MQAEMISKCHSFYDQANAECLISLLSCHVKNCRACRTCIPAKQKSMGAWNPPTVWWTAEWWWRSLTLAAIPFCLQEKVCSEILTCFLLPSFSLSLSHKPAPLAQETVILISKWALGATGGNSWLPSRTSPLSVSNKCFMSWANLLCGFPSSASLGISEESWRTY